MTDHPPIILKLPGHIFSEASQDLRDQINDWLDQQGIEDDQVNSCYLKDDSPQDTSIGGLTRHSSTSLTHMCFQFNDSKMAVMFKLAFG